MLVGEVDVWEQVFIMDDRQLYCSENICSLA